jgi:hypothetical protein
VFPTTTSVVIVLVICIVVLFRVCSDRSLIQVNSIISICLINSASKLDGIRSNRLLVAVMFLAPAAVILLDLAVRSKRVVSAAMKDFPSRS